MRSCVKYVIHPCVACNKRWIGTALNQHIATTSIASWANARYLHVFRYEAASNQSTTDCEADLSPWEALSLGLMDVAKNFTASWGVIRMFPESVLANYYGLSARPIARLTKVGSWVVG